MVVVFLVVSAIHNLLVFILSFFAYGEFFSVGVFNFPPSVQNDHHRVQKKELYVYDK